ncbi:putative RNA-dependent RNA polymerase [Anthurium mosaic-associated virus]|uniref:RNA-directed RNA polymerase n=1 Tax=Anthurium mosaic-associated virus TaxID=664255 RepID=D9U543_9VIRU|nr:putative RNA-dependent RNA polymerase [Anthurium mosaic-associated virus]ACU11563.1 putative RNA-dependent RNA polymerase [Anthurium mosaic-associated virus]
MDSEIKNDSGRFSADKIVSRKLRAYLGSTKCTLEYRERIFSSLGRLNDKVIEGLYAIVIPSGGGKTTMAREFGFIDVDEVIGNQAVMEKLVLERRELIRWGKDRWEEHNKVWYNQVHSVLAKYDFQNNPGIIMVHTEEMAYELGAQPLIALTPKDSLYKQRMKGRNELERMLAVDNLEIVRHRTQSVDIIGYGSWKELKQLIAGVAWEEVEMAAPFRDYNRKPAHGWPIGYGEDVALWIMQGKTDDVEDMRIVERLHREGSVPDICLSYYSEKIYGIKKIETKGETLCREWISICGEITNCGKMDTVTEMEVIANDLNLVYPYESKMAMNKRTIGLRRLLENMEAMRNDIMRTVLLNRRGSNQNLVVGILIWVGGVLSNMRVEIQDSVLRSEILLVPDEDWIKMGKKVHDMVRRTGTFFGTTINVQEAQKLMYLHMLYGRFVYQVDEEAEIDKRKRELNDTKMAYLDGEWRVDEFDKLELEGIRDAYRRLCDSITPQRVMDFSEFWKRRRSWAAKGSTVVYEGEKKYMLEIVDEVIRQLELRHNKKSLMEDEAECCKIISGIIRDLGRNDTKMVPKFESAAKRALLPGNLYHYVVFSYVLLIFENCASIGDVRLGNDRDNSFGAFDSKLETNLTRFVYDFADFNAQHSRRSMARVMSVLSETVDPNETLGFCLKWMSLSFNKMEVIKEGGGVEKLKSGLYSGWRGTTWINSVLNHAYMYVARVCFNRLYGYEPFVEYEGAGDDVDGVVKDISTAGKLYRITVEMGLESNVQKQLFGKRAEFLRVSYESGYAGSSICRVLGNFISGNWEGEGGSVSDRLTSAIDNILTLGRRGLDESMVKVLYRCVLMHVGRIFDGDEWIGLSPCILHGRMEDNGFGIPDEDGCVWELEKKAPAPDGWLGYIKLPAKTASRDWVDVIDEEIRDRGLKVGDVDRLSELLARDSYDVKSVADRFGTEISPEIWKKYWTYKCKVVKKYKIETDVIDEGMLLDFLEWLGGEETPTLDQLSKLEILGPYIETIVSGDDKPVTEEEWYGELYDAPRRLENMKLQRWKVVLCPPLVQSKIARWCKEMVANDMVTQFTGMRIYQIVSNTYGSIFGFEI